MTSMGLGQKIHRSAARRRENREAATKHRPRSITSTRPYRRAGSGEYGGLAPEEEAMWIMDAGRTSLRTVKQKRCFDILSRSIGRVRIGSSEKPSPTWSTSNWVSCGISAIAHHGGNYHRAHRHQNSHHPRHRYRSHGKTSIRNRRAGFLKKLFLFV